MFNNSSSQVMHVNNCKSTAYGNMMITPIARSARSHTHIPLLTARRICPNQVVHQHYGGQCKGNRMDMKELNPNAVRGSAGRLIHGLHRVQ